MHILKIVYTFQFGFVCNFSFCKYLTCLVSETNKTLQGRYDVCCPMMSAWDLHKAWPEAEFKVS